MFGKSAAKTSTINRTKDISKQSTSSYISIVPIVDVLFDSPDILTLTKSKEIRWRFAQKFSFTVVHPIQPDRLSSFDPHTASPPTKPAHEKICCERVCPFSSSSFHWILSHTPSI